MVKVIFLKPNLRMDIERYSDIWNEAGIRIRERFLDYTFYDSGWKNKYIKLKWNELPNRTKERIIHGINNALDELFYPHVFRND